MKRMNFSDQVNLLSAWFKEWSDCEQTVALYTLLKRVNTSQARFLDLVLEQMLAESEEYVQLEREANNPAFIGNLQNDQTALTKLLAHLPLLQPGSTRAKAEYMKMIPKILSTTMNEGLYSEESKQLLSYFMIHPAVTREERDSLSKWFVKLHEHSAAASHGQLSPENSSPPSPSSTPDAGRLAGKHNGWLAQNHQCSASSDSGIADTSGLAEPPHMHSILENTKSAPPAVNVRGPHNETIQTGLMTHHHLQQQGYQGRRSLPITPNVMGHNMPSTWSSQDDLGPFSSSSLHPPSDHAPLSPTSSGSSTEAQSEDGGHPPLQTRNSFMEENSGMKDVPAWLKSLRLHKYNSNFQQLSYDEMMVLNEEKLIAMKITEGARKKILREIEQLRNRQNLLRDLEKQLLEDDKPTTVREVLNRLKEEVVGTPLKKYEPPDHMLGVQTDPDTVPEGDIPGQLSRLLGKMLSKFLVQSRHQDAESMKTYMDILNKYVNHEAFTDVQRTRLTGWRKCCKNFSSSLFQSKQVQDRVGRTWSHQGPSYGPTDRGLQRCASTGRQPLARRDAYHATSHPTAHMQQNLLQVSGGAAGVYRPTQSGSGYVQPRQGAALTRTPVSRTKSVPPQGPFSQPQHQRLMRVNSPYYGTRQPDDNTSRQLENQLEDLCLSVTEHALGDGPNDKARDE